MQSRRINTQQMAPVQMRKSRVQLKTGDCVSDATTNTYLREWQAKPATECSMFCYESAQTYTCVKHQQTTKEIHQSKSRLLTTCTAIFLNPDLDYTNTLCYRPGISNRSPCSSGAFNLGVSHQLWKSQPTGGAGKSVAKQDRQNRSYPHPRKARKRHKKKRPKPSPPSQIKETQQLTDYPPAPLTIESVYKHKKKRTQGSPPTSKKVECAQSRDPAISHPLTMESFYRWYAEEQGCSTINPDYSWTPTVSKTRKEAEVTLNSESDSDSNYSDFFDSAKTRDPTHPNVHIGKATSQIVQSIEACYIAPVGHFHEEHKDPKRVETQHRRYSNPRRVGKKKLLDPISRHILTKAKRHTQPTQLRLSNNPRGNEERRVA
jgi:hypothetical protein